MLFFFQLDCFEHFGISTGKSNATQQTARFWKFLIEAHAAFFDFAFASFSLLIDIASGYWAVYCVQKLDDSTSNCFTPHERHLLDPVAGKRVVVRGHQKEHVISNTIDSEKHRHYAHCSEN